jgi:hypothetical protein
LGKITGCISVVLTFACIGLFAGYCAGQHQSHGGSVRWERIPLPDGARAFALHPGPFTEVIAQVDGGLSYVQMCTLTPEKWRRAPEMVSDGESVGLCGRNSDLSGLSIGAPPGPVIDQLDCQIGLEYTAVSCRYVILENGELWRWHFVGPGLQGELEGFAKMVGYTVGGASLGLVVYFAIVMLRKAKVQDRTGG